MTAFFPNYLLIIILYCKNQTGYGFPDPTGDAALPDAGQTAGAGSGRNNLAGIVDASDGEGGVEVLSDLSDHPISDGPGVDPGNVAGGVAALDDDGGAEGGDGLRKEAEGVVGSGVAGEHAHQKLV